MCDVLASLIFSKQGRPLSQHSNGEDGQQSATAKSVVGAKVSQLAHLFQSRSKEAEAAIPIATTTTTISPSAAAVPPVSPTSSVPAPPTAAVVGGRTKPSSRSETDKETAAHQDVNNRTRRNYVVNDWWKNNVIFYYFILSGSRFRHWAQLSCGRRASWPGSTLPELCSKSWALTTRSRIQGRIRASRRV